MQEEQDTCRICSGPAEPGQPLFYPCKCSGTIRYIHQDCLTTWLVHSKKKTCDVCKYPYSFTKVYSKDMPPRLPTLLLIRRLAQQLAVGLVFAVRTMLVAFVWLVFIPWATIWTWRMYFTVGDSAAWWISDRPRPSLPSIQENTTARAQRNMTMQGVTWPVALLHHPAMRTVSADVVSGQIISTIIVMAFVSVFLLREWISQNARPGVFDDAEAPPGPELPPQPAPGPVPDLAWLPPEVAEAGGRPPMDPAEAGHGARLPLTPETEAAPLTIEGLGTPPWDAVPGPSEVGRMSSDFYDFPTTDKGKGKAREDPSSSPTESRKRRHSAEDLYGPTPADTLLYPTPRSSEQHPLKLDFSSWDPLGQSVPPRPRPDVPEDVSPDVSPTLPQTPSRQGRPPLFSTAQFPDEEGAPSPRLLNSRGQTPLASPSLATYRAPEEFEAGPSNLTGYFPKPTTSNGDAEGGLSSALKGADEEYEKYFPLRRPGSSQGATYAASDEEPSDERDEDSDDMPPLSTWTDDEMEDGDGEHDDDADAPVLAPFPDPLGGPEPLDPDVEAEAEGDRPEGFQEGNMDQEAVDDLNDDMDAAMEDDMEGAMEAIGLRGPAYTIFQNAGLMIFVLDSAIGLGIWLPFTIGKSLALLSLDPRRLLFILHSPIRAIRIVTDPIVDSFMFLVSRLVIPPALRLLGACLAFMGRLLSAVIGQQGADKSFQLSSALFNRTADFANNTWTMILSPSDAAANTEPSFVDKLLAPESPVMRVLEPYFAPLGESVRIAWQNTQENWARLAMGNGTTEKIFAISLGYAVHAVLLALYLNVFSVGSMKSAGRAIRTAVRQQLLVVKVAVFIIVELVIFPLGCGVTLDICTVALFPQGSLRERLTFLTHAPLTSAFYHWVLGTMFMYQFAVLLAGFRTCLRPGALWFIKDPQDQNFHPIREILDRPALTHVRKLVLSGLMYGLVIMCSVGTIATILRIFSKTIMPFRWKLREPLSVVPVDLVFLHLVLPYTLQYFRPRKFLKQHSGHVWKFLASRLRLSSYMFGDPYPKEERTGSWPFVNKGSPSGTFRRVPNSDNVALLKDQPSTVEVTEEGVPINAQEAYLMMQQDIEAARSKRNIRDDYYVAYIPPYFRYRVFTFVASIWILCSVAVAAAFVVPILIGRGFFALFFENHMHDGYSFVAGFYLLWMCVLVSSAIDRMERHRQRRGGDEERADLALYFAKRSLLWMAQAAYMAFMLGVLIPTLVAVVVELYLILPARHTLNPEMRPKIRIVDMWALGLIYTKVLLRIQRMQVRGDIARGIDSIRRNGWTHMDPMKATKEVIAPLTAGLLGMVLLPPALVWAAIKGLRIREDPHEFYLLVYPSIFTLAACAQGLHTMVDISAAWQMTVRDKEFLVEMRLQNLEPEQLIAKLREAENVDTAEAEEEDDPDPDPELEVDMEVED